MEKGEVKFSNEDYPIPAIAQEYYKEFIHPTDGDWVISALSRACYELYIEEDSDFRSVLHDALQDRQTTKRHLLKPYDVINLSYRAIQKQGIELMGKHYADETHEEPETFKRLIRYIVSKDIDDGRRRETFYADMLYREITSNVITRIIPIRPVLRAHQERTKRKALVGMEVGAADGQLTKELFHNQKLAQLAKVLIATENFDGKDTAGLQFSEDATDFLREYDEVDVKMGFTVDIFNPNDEENMLWNYACRFRGKEFRNKFFRDLFTEFQNIKIPPLSKNLAPGSKMHFYEADFSQEGMSRFMKESPIQEFGYIMFPTVLYMQPDKAAEMIELAHQYLTEDGIIIILDRARPNPEDPTQLIWSDKFDFMNYRLLVQYPNDKRFYEIFILISDRSLELMIGKDFYKVAEGTGLEELARRAA